MLCCAALLCVELEQIVLSCVRSLCVENVLGWCGLGCSDVVFVGGCTAVCGLRW